MKKAGKIALIAAAAVLLAGGYAAVAVHHYLKDSKPKFADHLTASQQKLLAEEFFVPKESGSILCAGFRDRIYRIEAGGYADSGAVLDAFPFRSEELRESAKKEIGNPAAFQSGYQTLTGETVSAYRIYSLNSLEGTEAYDVYIFSKNDEWYFDVSKSMIRDDRFFAIFSSQE